MRRLRRWTLLPLLLLALAPGTGGVALSALHPCGADMPWLQGNASEHGGHHGHHGDAGGPVDDSCHCPDAPASVAAPALSVDGRVLVTAVVAVEHAVLHPAVSPPRHRPLDLLPPTTAPPARG